MQSGLRVTGRAAGFNCRWWHGHGAPRGNSACGAGDTGGVGVFQMMYALVAARSGCRDTRAIAVRFSFHGARSCPSRSWRTARARVLRRKRRAGVKVRGGGVSGGVGARLRDARLWCRTVMVPC